MRSKCDRCGKEYHKVGMRLTIEIYSEYDDRYYDSYHEICSECAKELDEFMQGKEVQKDDR